MRPVLLSLIFVQLALVCLASYSTSFGMHAFTSDDISSNSGMLLLLLLLLMMMMISPSLSLPMLQRRRLSLRGCGLAIILCVLHSFTAVDSNS